MAPKGKTGEADVNMLGYQECMKYFLSVLVTSAWICDEHLVSDINTIDRVGTSVWAPHLYGTSS